MTGDLLIGMACCVVAGIFFGTNYLPIKQVDCGDGFFFAAAMSVGILAVGAVVNFTLSEGPITESAEFYPLAMLGGMSWMLGNLLTPTIIGRLGLGLGLTVWDLSNMILGWATGSFGLFGVHRETVAQPLWNHCGLLLCCVSLAFFAQAGESDKLRERHGTEDLVDVVACRAVTDVVEQEDDECNPEQCGSADVEAGCSEEASDSTVASSGEPAQRKPDRKATARTVRTVQESKGRWSVGFLLALVAGCFFGWTFDMPIALMQCAKELEAQAHVTTAVDGALCSLSVHGNFSKNPFNYVFSHFCGIAATSVVALLAYVAVKRERAYTPRKVVLPSLLSGAMWGIGQAAWFEANERLSVVIAFPIISTLPGIVALFVGFAFFGEFRSRRSRVFAVLGLLVRIPGVALIALSGEGL